MKPNELLAWIDIETTGSNHRYDDLLEVACIVTTQDMIELGRVNYVLHHKCGVYGEGLPDNHVHVDVVVKMHDVNGLWELCEKSDITDAHFDEQFNQWLSNILWQNPGYEKFVMAGSGVARFDYTWFAEEEFSFMPFFSYYTLDIGVVRRALKLNSINVKNKTPELQHRAMSDIEHHIYEWQVMSDLLKHIEV